VIELLRAIAQRPVDGSNRGSAFAVAALMVLAAASGLLVTRGASRPASRPAKARSVASSAPAAVTAAAPVRRPFEAAAPPQARVAARRFLADYLVYLYDPRRATIRFADRRLTARLRRQRVRPAPALRRRRPRVVALRARRLGRTVAVDALIADGGVARYPIVLRVAPGRAGWRVIAVGGE
jgi:hypothetical protein